MKAPWANFWNWASHDVRAALTLVALKGPLPIACSEREYRVARIFCSARSRPLPLYGPGPARMNASPSERLAFQS